MLFCGYVPCAEWRVLCRWAAYWPDGGDGVLLRRVWCRVLRCRRSRLGLLFRLGVRLWAAGLTRVFRRLSRIRMGTAVSLSLAREQWFPRLCVMFAPARNLVVIRLDRCWDSIGLSTRLLSFASSFWNECWLRMVTLCRTSRSYRLLSTLRSWPTG